MIVWGSFISIRETRIFSACEAACGGGISINRRQNISHSLLTEKQLGIPLWYGSNIWPCSWPSYYTSRIIIVGIFIRHTYSTYSCRQQVDYLFIFEDFTYEYYIYVIFMHSSLLNLSCVSLSPPPRLITASSLLLSTHTCGILLVLLG